MDPHSLWGLDDYNSLPGHALCSVLHLQPHYKDFDRGRRYCGACQQRLDRQRIARLSGGTADRVRSPCSALFAPAQLPVTTVPIRDYREIRAVKFKFRKFFETISLKLP